MMIRNKDTYLMTSGRRFNANRGLISIAINENHFEICHGYDGELIEAEIPIVLDNNGEFFKTFTVEERQELADHMIALWQAYKRVLL